MARPGIEPRTLTYESDALPTALRDPASGWREIFKKYFIITTCTIGSTEWKRYLGERKILTSLQIKISMKRSKCKKTGFRGFILDFAHY